MPYGKVDQQKMQGLHTGDPPVCEHERKAALIHALRNLDHEMAMISIEAITPADLAMLRPLGRWIDKIILRRLQRKRELTNALAKAA